MSYYLAVLKNYAGFSGRVRRREYWLFVLFHVIAVAALLVIDRLLFDQPFITMTYLVATIIPILAVSVRRLHDADRSAARARWDRTSTARTRPCRRLTARRPPTPEQRNRPGIPEGSRAWTYENVSRAPCPAHRAQAAYGASRRPRSGCLRS
jgi:hypothetical protein